MAGIVKTNKVDADRHADFRIADSKMCPGWIRVAPITWRAKEWCNANITNGQTVPCEHDGTLLFDAPNQHKLGAAILNDGFDVGDI